MPASTQKTISKKKTYKKDESYDKQTMKIYREKQNKNKAVVAARTSRKSERRDRASAYK